MTKKPPAKSVKRRAGSATDGAPPDKQNGPSDNQNGQDVNASPKPGMWPADRISRLKVDALLAYPRNARLHTDGQVEQLATAINRFGFTNPVVVDWNGEIIAGHGRVMAARKLGLIEVPGVVIGADEWTEDDRQAYRIWDNQSALLSTWDDELLRLDVQELSVKGYDLQLLGFPAMTLGVILDGWSSDVDVKARFGANLEGIKAKIIIMVAPDQAERASAIITKALADAGIAHEVA